MGGGDHSKLALLLLREPPRGHRAIREEFWRFAVGEWPVLPQDGLDAVAAVDPRIREQPMPTLCDFKRVLVQRRANETGKVEREKG